MKRILILCLFSFSIIVQSCRKEQILQEPQKTNGADNSVAQSFSVNNVLQSNMVIQRGKPFRVWGKSAANDVVTVKASWNAGTYSATTDADGNWIVSIPSSAANKNPQTITCSVTGQTTITLNNILIGDVWVCSGQSNMVMPMDRVDNPDSVFGGFYGVQNYQAEIAAANFPEIRVMTMNADFKSNPLQSLSYKTNWITCSPTTAGKFSALGYYFAKKIDSVLHVPVGIIVSAVGATSCEAWTSKEAIQGDAVLNSYYYGKNFSCQLYNGMIYPLRNLSVKGFLWDQGENNRGDDPVSNYTLLNIAMLKNWRTTFNQGDLPFYFVQMTPLFAGEGGRAFDYALFREAQANVRSLVNTGMAVGIDVPETFVIHYTYKQPVADRLARLALHYTYNIAAAKANGPSYTSFSQNGNIVTITFDNAAGLYSNGSLEQFFYVAGADQKFWKATAVISGTTITLTVPTKVTQVFAVRYLFTNHAVGNIYNGDGLPMEPFRTDNY